MFLESSAGSYVSNELYAYLISFGSSAEMFLSPYLKDLDPSLFQNVILGILALLVPVGVAILNFFFEERSKGEIKANLELFILLKQVLKAKEIVLFSILTLSLLSIYEFGLVYQILAIICFIVYVCWMITSPLKNIWKWLLENNKDFAIPFLKNIDLRKENKLALTSWNALWLGVDGGREREITDIFTSQIDNLIRSKDFEIAIGLSRSYISNIEKRDHFMIGYEVLPKILEWNEFFWEQEQYWVSMYKQEDFISKLFSQKYLRFFKKPALLFLGKVYKKQEYFWNWHFFQKEFLQAIIKVLLNGSHDSYELFTNLKKHIDACLVELEKIEDKEEKERYWNYITSLVGDFCEVFFEDIDKARSTSDIWNHYFPKEWKVTSSNIGNSPSRIFLHEFQKWISDRIFGSQEKEFDNKLSEVISGLFPAVHADLFPYFLGLFFSSEIKYIIENDPNIFMVNIGISWVGERTDVEIDQLVREQDRLQREETVKVIYGYFSHWPKIKLYTEDLMEEEILNWKQYDEEKRKDILNRVRIMKLQNLIDELNGEEILNICAGFERKEFRRTKILTLVRLLLEEVERS